MRHQLLLLQTWNNIIFPVNLGIFQALFLNLTFYFETFHYYFHHQTKNIQLSCLHTKFYLCNKTQRDNNKKQYILVQHHVICHKKHINIYIYVLSSMTTTILLLSIRLMNYYYEISLGDVGMWGASQ